MIKMSKAIVLYNSRGGNTEKVAKKIADGLEAEIRDLRNIPDLKDYDLIVVGTWVIMFSISPAGRRLIRRIRRKNIAGKKVALFLTCGGPEEIHPSTKDDENPKTIQEVIFKRMEQKLNKKGNITLLPDRFYCIGALRMFGNVVEYEGHPSDEKLAEAKAFGEQLKKYIET